MPKGEHRRNQQGSTNLIDPDCSKDPRPATPAHTAQFVSARRAGNEGKVSTEARYNHETPCFLIRTGTEERIRDL